jgi:hypothetical protein
VCSLQLLLAVATAVIFGSKSHGARDPVLLPQIRGFSFRRLLRLAGLQWKYSNQPPNGILTEVPNELTFITWCVPETEHPLQLSVCCNLRIRCHGNAVHRTSVQERSILRYHENACLQQNLCVSKTLPRNGSPLRLHQSDLQAFWYTRHGNVLSEALPSNG